MTEKRSITVTGRDNVDEIDVLVVDDDAAIREIVARVLRKSGYACRSASDASEALEEATRRTPMLTVADVRMPGRDGTWLLKELKKRWPDMAVIMLTADTEAKTAVQCLKDGAEDYLVKPIDVDELKIAARRTIEKVQLLREAREQRTRLDMVSQQRAKLQEALHVI